MKNKILSIIKSAPANRRELNAVKRKIFKNGSGIISNSEIFRVYSELIAAGKIKKDKNLERLLRKRSVRTMSGIAPVAVLTKPWPCPGKCVYCPTQKNVPVSYLSNEPAVMRAIRNKYKPFSQVWQRLRALEANGHDPSKIELIVMGGTWSCLPNKYKYWYISECFRAANEYRSSLARPSSFKNRFRELNKQSPSQNSKIDSLKNFLEKEQKKNEKARHRIVGLTLETRPDRINKEELVMMRELGCTRVEMGVQAINDDILKKNRRGHGVDKIVEATKLLRDFGFKITYHLMPGLLGSSVKKDLEMFEKLFSDERFQPDQIKFYPTVVVKGSLLYKWWKQGKYKPYSDRSLQELIVKCKKRIPKYVRIIRLIRDIPGESIEAGNKITNLRQIMKKKGVECSCIRCRECRDKQIEEKDLRLNMTEYEAADGKEYFISFDSKDGKTLYGFCRLRLPGASSLLPKEFDFLKCSAIIRELHIYGELVSPGGEKRTQHTGLGKRLMKKAEDKAREAGFKRVAVISGVGVRGYYRKLGYRKKSFYMVKGLSGKQRSG